MRLEGAGFDAVTDQVFPDFSHTCYGRRRNTIHELRWSAVSRICRYLPAEFDAVTPYYSCYADESERARVSAKP